MNPVEIEQALSDFAETPFEPIEFPYGFLACFGRKANELKSLRSGTTNKSDLEHAVLLRNAVHICVCPEGEVTKHLATLRQAPETAKWKAKLALATDGQTIEAENIITGETFVCDYTNLPDHFGALPSFQKYRENDLKKIHYQQRWRNRSAATQTPCAEKSGCESLSSFGELIVIITGDGSSLGRLFRR